MDESVERALAEARALGFLGPGPLDQHERSAQAFLEALPPLATSGRMLDLGSGGGVPGLLLAAALPTSSWVLLDNHRRRTSFLSRVVADLGWGGRVEVLRAPAEQAAHDPRYRGRFAAVVSRSFGPPATTAECGAAFLVTGGRLLVAEPPAPDPARWPDDGLAVLGLRQLAGGSIAVLQRIAEPRADVPRSWRALERHPRW